MRGSSSTSRRRDRDSEQAAASSSSSSSPSASPPPSPSPATPQSSTMSTITQHTRHQRRESNSPSRSRSSSPRPRRSSAQQSLPSSPASPSSAASSSSSSYAASSSSDSSASDSDSSSSSSSDDESAYGDPDVFVPPPAAPRQPLHPYHLSLTAPARLCSSASRVQRKVDAAKRKHRTSLSLPDWQRYGYADSFPAIRQQMYEEMVMLRCPEGAGRREAVGGEAGEVRFPWRDSYAPPIIMEKTAGRDGSREEGKSRAREAASASSSFPSSSSSFSASVTPSSSFSELTINVSPSSSMQTPSPSFSSSASAAAALSCPPPLSEYLQSSFPVSAGLDRIHCEQLSVDRFIREYEQPYIPCLLLGLTADWNARHWTPASLSQSPLRQSFFKCGEDDDGYSVKLRLKHFLSYQQQQRDDSPLYIFDSAFDERSVSASILNDFTPPRYFTDDLFHLLGEDRRPPYRWVAIGPERSGSSLHVDPLATSAWNALLFGVKRWVLFPPSAPKSLVKGESLKQRGEDNEAITYFVRILPRIREEERRRARAGLPLLGMREVLQHAGETIFVPGGWWHAVLNLTDTIAITQNYASATNFPAVWRRTRAGRRKMSRVWLRRLWGSGTWQHLATMAVLLNDEDGWETEGAAGDAGSSRRHRGAVGEGDKSKKRKSGGQAAVAEDDSSSVGGEEGNAKRKKKGREDEQDNHAAAEHADAPLRIS